MFKKDYERTPQQRAQRSMFSIVARLGACAYLIYIIYQMLANPPKDSSPGPTGITIIAIVLIVAAAGVIAMTVYDLVIALRTHRFSASTYEELDESGYNNAVEEHEAPSEIGEGTGDIDETEDNDKEPADDTPSDDDADDDGKK